jgi:protein kinase-like protein
LNIVHRDVSPDNVLVSFSGAVKLVDFGIAKAMEGPAGDQVTKSGFVVGTPEYMSPEQLSGDPVGPRSDEYALALVFYRMLTGTLPFEASSLQETLSKRLTDPPRPLAESRPAANFPAGLQAIMDRALARRAEERYGSVLEFADAVHSAVSAGAGPTRKLGVEPARPLATPSSRGAKLAVGAVGMLVLAGAVWGVFEWSPGRTVAGGEDTAQATPAAGLGTSDTGSRTTPVRGAAQPAPGRREATPDDTGQLDLGALDSLPARRTAELRRAERQLELSGLSRRRKAAAAEFLGLAALGDRNRDSARILYRLAYRLDQNPRYLETLRQLGDTIQP